jgi:hypothetical protein
MSILDQTLRQVGIDSLGIDPFLSKVGLDGEMTVRDLQRLLKFGAPIVAALDSLALADDVTDGTLPEGAIEVVLPLDAPLSDPVPATDQEHDQGDPETAPEQNP